MYMSLRKIPVGVYIENYHHSGTLTVRGVNSVIVYGTNSLTAFNNTDAGSTVELIPLSAISVLEHPPVDAEHPQWFSYQNTVEFRYIVYRILSNYGDPYSAIRRLETLVRNTPV